MKLLKYYYNKNLVKKYLNNTIPTPKEMPQLSLQRSMNTLAQEKKLRWKFHSFENYGKYQIPLAKKLDLEIAPPLRHCLRASIDLWVWAFSL